MKKTGFIVLVIAMLIVAGCNEKTLKKQLIGSWEVEKYLVEERDSTATFDSTYIDFVWTFAEANQTYTKAWKTKHLMNVVTYDTTFATDTAGNTIITDIDTLRSTQTSYTDHQASGRWVLFNGNDFVQLRDSATAPALDYHIKSHTAKSLVLTRGNTEWQLKAK